MEALLTSLLEAIADGIEGVLIDLCITVMSGIYGNLENTVNSAATDVGQTPYSWNASIVAMMERISDEVMIPLAGLVLTYVMTYELINLLLDKNAGHEVGYDLFFKWLLKTMIAIELTVNGFDIVQAIFYMAQKAINKTSGIVTGTVTLGVDVEAWKESLVDKNIAELIGFLAELGILQLLMTVGSLLIVVIVYSRMMEIYLYCAVGPFALATFTNKDFGNIGQNYLKSMIALALQGILMLVLIAMYAMLVTNVVPATPDKITDTIWEYALLTIVLGFMLFKTGGIAKSIMSAS